MVSGVVRKKRRGERKRVVIRKVKGKKKSGNDKVVEQKKRGPKVKKFIEYFQEEDYDTESAEPSCQLLPEAKKKRAANIYRDMENILRNVTSSKGHREAKVGNYEFSLMIGKTCNVIGARGFEKEHTLLERFQLGCNDDPIMSRASSPQWLKDMYCLAEDLLEIVDPFFLTGTPCSFVSFFEFFF